MGFFERSGGALGGSARALGGFGVWSGAILGLLDGFGPPNPFRATPFGVPCGCQFRTFFGSNATTIRDLGSIGVPEGDVCKMRTAPERDAHFCLRSMCPPPPVFQQSVEGPKT